MTNRLHFLLIVIIAVFSSACSNTKFMVGDQMLYTGRKVIFVGDSLNKKNYRVRQVCESVTSFKPNNSIGGKRVLLPVGLWVYNYWKKDENKKQGWLYRTLAKEPVLVSNAERDIRSAKLESDLFSVGFFHSKVWSQLDTSRNNPKKARVNYFVRPGRPFRYGKISFASPQDPVDSLINSRGKDFLPGPGNIFDLETLKWETKKTTDLLTEKGYFYFNQTSIKYIADTTNAPFTLDLMVAKNNESLQNAFRKYFIRDITVKINSETDSLNSDINKDTLMYDGIKIISVGRPFKPEVITRSIYFRKGDSYSVTRHRQTMTHLNSYGIFKYINLRYYPDPDTLVNKLDMLIELTPAKDISLDLETNVVTKSTGFSGPGIVVTLAQGNLARGANRLQLKLNGGVEWQWTNNTSSTLGTISYNAGVSSSIIFPRLILPQKYIKPGRFNLPQTTLTMGVELLNKIQYYRMSSMNIGFGYTWKKPDKITQTFYPLFVNSIALLKTTPEFDSILLANPYIRKSFEEQFIVGMKYNFIYDNSFMKKTNGFYFQGGVSTAGNLLDLMHSISSKETLRPYMLAGNVYSQFLKLTSDIRYYRNFRNQSLAFRFYSGIGFPYSNSVVMPYVEQFYSGGSNSIRAFIARSLGPGGLPPPESSEIIDQTGDIKLEGNLEYRFDISKVLKGAFFLDAGNVWLLNPDETRPEAEFRFNSFMSQLAVGTGIGFRFDFNFFVLRTDFGFPLRTPYKTGGSNWLPSAKDVLEGMVFNLAIGYPF